MGVGIDRKATFKRKIQGFEKFPFTPNIIGLIKKRYRDVFFPYKNLLKVDLQVYGQWYLLRSFAVIFGWKRLKSSVRHWRSFGNSVQPSNNKQESVLCLFKGIFNLEMLNP